MRPAAGRTPAGEARRGWGQRAPGSCDLRARRHSSSRRRRMSRPSKRLALPETEWTTGRSTRSPAGPTSGAGRGRLVHRWRARRRRAARRSPRSPPAGTRRTCRTATRPGAGPTVPGADRTVPRVTTPPASGRTRAGAVDRVRVLGLGARRSCPRGGRGGCSAAGAAGSGPASPTRPGSVGRRSAQPTAGS